MRLSANILAMKKPTGTSARGKGKPACEGSRANCNTAHCDENLNSWFNFGSRYNYFPKLMLVMPLFQLLCSLLLLQVVKQMVPEIVVTKLFAALWIMNTSQELFSMQKRIQSTHNNIFSPYLTGK